MIAAAIALVVPDLAHAWWSGDWAYRKKITFNTTNAGTEIKTDASGATLLLRMHSGNFSFIDSKEDGSDVRFVASDDKTPLKFHVEQWDAANQLAFVWVQIPKITANASAEYIWAYYGNDKAAPAGDAKTSYDPSTLAVLHFDDKANVAKDSGPFAFPATATGATPGAAGVIGHGASFANGGKVTFAPAPALKAPAATGVTIGAWVKFAAAQGSVVVVEFGEAGKSVVVGLDGDKPFAQAGTAKAVGNAGLSPSAWHHVAATLEDKLTVYVDGAEAGSAPATAFDVAGTLSVGDSVAGGAQFKGDIDEVEVSAVARSADFIRLTALNQSTTDTKLVGWGQDETGSSSGNSYFAILLHSVTLDGWVVIGILMVMAVISFYVMGAKAVYIARTSKGNRLFQSQFSKLSTNLLALHDGGAARPAAAAGHDAPSTTAAQGKPKAKSKAASAKRGGVYAESCLYRIYDLGVRELITRFDACERDGRPKTLTPQALNAIKASLDAGYVRETHRLNSLLVLLTIAISGGPFLGLLGTVVGVMITFAAIAAAGDVNVNAIAPGIAAALVATVAGLAVAIPSLFGYNYLSSQIKNITADMQVFNDEFLSKLAERYT